jgi:multicomponent Na+:H+ antiporter subunit A
MLVAGVPSLATAVWLLASLPGVVDGQVDEQRWRWVSGLGLEVVLRLDGFSALMLLLVAGLGVAVFAYAAAYHRDEDHAIARQAGLLTLFGGAMTGLVLADDLVLLVTCWELTSITSYLLIGNRHTEARARAAALQALVVTGAGGLCLLAGVVLLGSEAGTYRMSALLREPPTGGSVGIALVLVLIGVATKSAQYPFHGWLPTAMVAPTPVSAYLHSATMVKAGVYLLARFAPAFASHGWWRPVVLSIGLLTMAAGALRALRQHDLKLLLALGTVSQLGFLVVLAGSGVPGTTEAACVLLLAHGAFKAALFFLVGALDRTLGTRDLRELPSLGRRWRPLGAAIVVSCASMAGVPLALGFAAKEAGYAGLTGGPFGGSGLVLAAAVAASALTGAYSWRFAWGVLGAPARRGAALHLDPPTWGLVAPTAVLAGATLAFGLAPGLLDGVVGAAAASLDPAIQHVHLALWHGFELPLLLSGVTLAGAAVVVAVRSAGERWVSARRLPPTSGDVYVRLLRGLNRGADRVTGVVQSGSLPVYTGVILLTAALLPTAALLLGGDRPALPRAVDAPAHVPIAALLVGSALAAALIRRRLSAALFLGLTGYGMAGFFVIQGAPDLALTQVTVETLSTVLFVLVLRHLPVNFERKSTPRTRALRIAVAAAVGLGVFAFALNVGTVREGTAVSDEIAARAEPEGHGRNIVNVILVDVRGFDTMGEITVLATAAIGMVALARAGRRPRRVSAAQLAAAGGEEAP